MKTNPFRPSFEKLKDEADKLPCGIELSITGDEGKNGKILVCWENNKNMVFEVEDQESLDAVMLANSCWIE